MMVPDGAVANSNSLYKLELKRGGQAFYIHGESPSC